MQKNSFLKKSNKKIVLITFFVLVSCSMNFGQTVMKMTEAHEKLNQDSIHKIYFDRLMTDEIIEVFETSTDFFMREWRGFTNAYGRFLFDKHFDFGKQMKATIEVCFNKNEGIDLFLIKMNDTTFTDDQYTKLLALTKEFCKTYKFTLDASKPFMNSGLVTFSYSFK